MRPNKKTLAIHFTRFGPYHFARISNAVEILSQINWAVVGLETSCADDTYAWRVEAGEHTWKRKTVFSIESLRTLDPRRIRRGIVDALDELKPNVVAIAGWGSIHARACFSWCKRNDVKMILMCETREADGKRVWWKEWIKRLMVSKFDAALVGGESHKDYLVKLGMKSDRIYTGYNVVNNDYFKAEALKHRKSESPRVRPYFLASNRFLERKNLDRLVEAYSIYSKKLNRKERDRLVHRTNPEEGWPEGQIKNQKNDSWDLCLLGDGELKPKLISLCRQLGLQVVEHAPWEADESSVINHPSSSTVFLPGFRQIDELPQFYAHAGCFVHPALEEPWGLVINEAMASGLPILSSFNVGAAEELVDDGVNGFVFDPNDINCITENLIRISGADCSLFNFGEASQRILEERCPTSAFGVGLKDIMQVWS